MTARVLVIGGAGVFGGYIVQELLSEQLDCTITIGGRHQPKALTRDQYGAPLAFQTIDLTQPNLLTEQVRGFAIVINSAGPFGKLSAQILLAIGAAGCHYLDLCDDPDFFQSAWQLKAQLQQSGKIFLVGLSSLPGISLPLTLLAARQLDAVTSVDIGLFIGNDNQKGRAAVGSALQNLSRPATFWRAGKQVLVSGWTQKYDFPFPMPINAVPAYSFASPDAIAISAQIPITDLSVRVAFEWALARASFSLFKRLANIGCLPLVRKAIDVCFPLFALAHHFGSQRGCVSVLVTGIQAGQPKCFRASLLGEKRGQTMASLPCVIATKAILNGEIKASGLVPLGTWLAPEEFLRRLQPYGFSTSVEEITCHTLSSS